MQDLRWPTYKTRETALVRAHDVGDHGALFVEDSDGKVYLDAVNGIGCGPLGQCHPRWVAAIAAQAGQLSASANSYRTLPQQALARALGERMGIPDARSFLCNTGAESTEAAVKLVLRATGRDVIIAFERSFHGRTFAAVALTANPSYREPFIAQLDEPHTGHFAHINVVRVPFLDLDAVKATFERLPNRVAAVFVEPVQGEGGIYAATKEQLLGLRELCTRYGALLGTDEVQSGSGRTGHWTAWQTIVGPEGTTRETAPDLTWVAKAIGGGYPVAACVTRADLAAHMIAGSHGTTFGGNPIACAAALATIEIIESEGLLRSAAAQVEILRKIAAEHPIAQVSEIRGLGAMIGIQIGQAAAKLADPLGSKMPEQGVLVTICGGHTVRLLLPYRAGEQELRTVWQALERSLQST